MKKIISIMFAFTLILIFNTEFTLNKIEWQLSLKINQINNVYADQTCIIEMFWRDWCAHCKDEKAFLEKLENDWVHKFQYHNIWDPIEKERFLKLVEIEWLPKVVPLTFINGKVIQWFDTEDTTWKEIKDIIENVKNQDLLLLDDYLKNWTKKNVVVQAPKWTCSVDESWVEICKSPEHQSKFVKVPFFW